MFINLPRNQLNVNYTNVSTQSCIYINMVLNSEHELCCLRMPASLQQTDIRTFWLYKGIGMLKLGRMHRQTGEKFVDPTAMSRQMREVSDF